MFSWLEILAVSLWFFAVPGYCLVVCAFDEDFPMANALLLGTLVGFHLTPYIAYLLGLLGLPAFSPFLPAPFLALAVLRWIKKRSSLSIRSFVRGFSWPACLTLVLAFWAIGHKFLAWDPIWKTDPASSIYQFAGYDDHLYRLAVIHEVGRAFPPTTNPFLSGAAPRPYHYFSEAAAAVLSQLAGQDPWNIYFYYMPLLIVALLCLGVFLFIKNEGLSAALAALPLGIIFLLPYSLGSWAAWVDGSIIFRFIAYNRPALVGLVAVLAWLITLQHAWAKPSWKNAALAGALLAALYQWKAQYFVVLVPIFAASLILPMEPKLRRWGALSLAFTALFAAPLILHTMSTASGVGIKWRYAPLAWILLEEDRKTSFLLNALKTHLHDFGLFLITCLIYLRTLGLGAAAWAFLPGRLRDKEWEPLKALFLAMAAIIFIFYLGVGPKEGPSWTIAGETSSVLFSLSVLFGSVWFLRGLKPENLKILKIALPCVFFIHLAGHPRQALSILSKSAWGRIAPSELPTLPLTVKKIPKSFNAPCVWDRMDPDEKAALDFIRSQTPADATLVHARCVDSHWAFGTAVSYRRTAMEQGYLWDGEGSRYELAPKRRRDLELLYKTASAQEARRILADIGGELVVWESRERPLRFPTNNILGTIYKNAGVRLYRRK